MADMFKMCMVTGKKTGDEAGYSRQRVLLQAHPEISGEACDRYRNRYQEPPFLPDRTFRDEIIRTETDLISPGKPFHQGLHYTTHPEPLPAIVRNKNRLFTVVFIGAVTDSP